MHSTIEHIKQTISIESIAVSRYGLRLYKKSPIAYSALCPFHREKTPSFFIYCDTNEYHCYGCGAHGDVIDFVKNMENFTDIKDAVSALDGKKMTISSKSTKARLHKNNDSRRKMHNQVADLAKQMWSTTKDIANCKSKSSYFKKKNIESVEGIKQESFDSPILIPMLDDNCKIWNLQIISTTADGSHNKRFLKGGRAKGLFFPIGGTFVKNNKVIIAEGIATALTLYNELKIKTLCAFSANNIAEVAKSVRAKRPGYEIIIAADNDGWDDDKQNIGLFKANQAAKEYSCKVVFPKFPEQDSQYSDFNDYANICSTHYPITELFKEQRLL